MSDVCVRFTNSFQKPRADQHNVYGVLSGRLLYQPVGHPKIEDRNDHSFQSYLDNHVYNYPHIRHFSQRGISESRLTLLFRRQ